MATEALWDRLWSRLTELSTYGWSSLQPHDVRAAAEECNRIRRELQARTAQGQLFP